MKIDQKMPFLRQRIQLIPLSDRCEAKSWTHLVPAAASLPEAAVPTQLLLFSSYYTSVGPERYSSNAFSSLLSTALL